MNRVLAEVVLRSARGLIVRRLRLARRPRYLAGLLAGVAYLAWSMSMAVHWRTVPDAVADAIGSAAARPGLHLAAALGLAVGLTLPWIFLRGRAALGLSEADVQLLLPAPVPRRTLLQYALLKGQPGILAGAVVLALFFGGAGSLGQRMARAPGYWLVLTLFDLHNKGCALWKARQRDLAAAAARRRFAFVATLLAGFWIVVAFGAADLWRAFYAAVEADRGTAWHAVGRGLAAAGRSLDGSVLATVLAPLLWVTGPLAGDRPALSFLFALPLLLVAHEWVVRSSARFEEPTLAAAERRSRRRGDPAANARERRPAHRRRTRPFALGPLGPPAVAVYWKNVAGVWRRPLPLLVGFVVLALAAVAALIGYAGAPAWLLGLAAGIGLPTALLFALLGGGVFQNDLRSELGRLDLLRTWPVRPAGLVAAEVLAPASLAMFAATAGLGLVLAADAGHRLALSVGRGQPAAWLFPDALGAVFFAPAWLVPWFFAAAAWPVLAALAVLSSALQNLLVLAFPGWVDAAGPRRNDAAAFGQRILFVSGLVVVLTVALVPSAALVALAVLAQGLVGWPVVAWELPLLGAVAALPALGEAALLVFAASRLWARLDPSAEILN